MYSDYRLYLPFESSQVMSKPSGVCSNQLFLGNKKNYIDLSAALKRNFGDYLKNKMDIALKRP